MGFSFRFASLVLTDPEVQRLLKERFDMIKNRIAGDYIYELVVKEAREEARRQWEEEKAATQALQAMQQAVITVIAAHFPRLAGLAKAIIATISDQEHLQKLLIEFSFITDQEQAQQLLLSLVMSEPVVVQAQGGEAKPESSPLEP
jgi:hypothetical protein